MRILDLDVVPIHEVPYLSAGRRGAESVRLPIHVGYVDTLPPDLDALVATSDLQGVVPAWEDGASMLLGEALVIELLALDVLHTPARTGAILAGDLFSAPGGDVRGASGDVRAVWEAFSDAFRWVAGVAGNHDRFGALKEEHRLRGRHNVNRLDDRWIDVDGLRLAGVDHIIGDPSRPGRRDEGSFIAALADVLSADPDIVVLHEGPDAGRARRGSSAVRGVLERVPQSPLTICGHTHWDEPIAGLERGAQALNVDSRVVILTRGTP